MVTVDGKKSINGIPVGKRWLQKNRLIDYRSVKG